MGALEKKTLCATEKEEKGRNSAFLGLCSEKLAMCPKDVFLTFLKIPVNKARFISIQMGDIDLRFLGQNSCNQTFTSDLVFGTSS